MGVGYVEIHLSKANQRILTKAHAVGFMTLNYMIHSLY